MSILFAILSIFAIVFGFTILLLLIAFCQNRINNIRQLAVNPMHKEVYDN